MNRVSVALAANFSAALSLLGLYTNGPITFGVTRGETTGDTFTLWGSLDSAAVGGDNVANLGNFAGLAGSEEVPLNIAEQARMWPYLLVQRTAGSTAGTFYAVGDAAPAPAIVSAAAPAGVAYSAVMDLTTFSASGVRIGGSAAMTSTDVFDVFLTEDNTVVSSVGCYYAGRIRGGGGTEIISILTKGWPYAIVQRVSGATAGNILGAGVAPIAGGALNLTPLNVGNTAAGGNIGGLTAAQTVDVYSYFRCAQTTVGQTLTLAAPTAGAAAEGKIAFVANNGTASFLMYGETVNIGATQVYSWNGTAWGGGANLTQGGNAFAATVRAGSVDAQSTEIVAGNVVFLSSTTGGAIVALGPVAGSSVTVGNALTTTAASLLSGTGVALVQSAAGGNVVISTGVSPFAFAAGDIPISAAAGGIISIFTTGAGVVNITGGTGTSSWDIGAGGTLNLSRNATDHTTNLGSLTGVSVLSLQSGTGVSGWNVSATGTLNLGSNATDHTTALGSVTGVSATTINSGTGSLVVTSMNDVTFTVTDAYNVNTGGLIAFSSSAGAFTVSTGGGSIMSLTSGTAMTFLCVGGGITLQPGPADAVSLPPRAAGAGNTTSLRFLELAASGVNYVAFKAPDALAANTEYTLPDALPTISGQQLVGTTAGVMSWSGVVNVDATNTNAQVIADGVAEVAVTTWTEITDTAGAFNAATGVFTVPVTGFYWITATLQYAATAADLAVEFRVSIAVGGVSVKASSFINPVAALAQTRSVQATHGMQLTAAQTVDIRAFVGANGGVDVALTATAVANTLSISKIG